MPQSATNLSIIVTNIPILNAFCIYTFSLLIPVSTYKVYGSTVSINGSTYTPVSSGGYATSSVNTSATYIIQQYSIIMTVSLTVPQFVMTNIISLY